MFRPRFKKVRSTSTLQRGAHARTRTGDGGAQKSSFFIRAGLVRSGILAGVCMLALLGLSGLPGSSMAAGDGTVATSETSSASSTSSVSGTQANVDPAASSPLVSAQAQASYDTAVAKAQAEQEAASATSSLGTELTPQDDVLASGTFWSCSSATWSLSTAGVLTIDGYGTVSQGHGGGWDAYSSQIRSVNFQGTCTYTSLSYWFAECTNLGSVVLPSGAEVTDLSGLFYDCSSLWFVALPDGFGKNATKIEMMFFGCKSLANTYLYSGFPKAAGYATGESSMFSGCTALKEVHLGTNWSFKNSDSTVICQLPDPPAPYSMWRAVGSGSTTAPKGAVYTSAALASSYTSSMAGAYVWRTALSGSVSMSGTCGVDCTLTAAPSSAPSDATMTYAWYEASDSTSAGTQVSDKATYTPTISDFGKYLYVTATDSSGNYGGTLTSSRSMVVITGTFPSDTAASWTITPDGALTFAGTGTVTNSYGDGGTPWYTYKTLITTAAFTGSVSFINLEYWFADLPNLTTVTFPEGFGKDTTSMGGMFGGCPALTSVSFPTGCGANARSTAYMFNEDHALKSVTMPADFAKSATYMSYMFCGCRSMPSMTLPSGFALSAALIDGMFYGCYGMTYLDASATSIPAVTKMDAMFLYCTALKQIKLGAGWSFKGSGTTVLTQLPDPQSPYTMWRAVGAGTVDSPKGAMYTAADLASAYTGSMADTYVWAPVLTGTLAAAGTPSPGSTLTATPSGTPSDATLSYTWYTAADTTSAGTQVQTGKTYSPAAGDVGKYAYVTATDSSGAYTGTLTSSRVAVKAALTGSVSVSGTFAAGSTLTASPNGVQTDATLSYTWYSAPDQSSAGTSFGTGTTCPLAAAQAGTYVYATATDTSGKYLGTVQSVRTFVTTALTGALALSSPCGVGYAMTASSTAQADATLSYSWYLAADAMSPGTLVSTASSYKPALADFGKYLYVTATDSSGKYTGFVSSPRTMVVITGTFASDTAAAWTITPDGAITFVGTGTVTDTYGVHTTPWYTYQNLITSAVFKDGVSYANLDYWFRDCTSLASISFAAGVGQSSTSLFQTFGGCSALTSLNLPAGFGQSATNVRAAFAGCSSLKSLTLPTGFGQNATTAHELFADCSQLETLDLSGADMRKAAAFSYVFDSCSALKQVKLGANWSFNNGSCQLPTPSSPYSLWRAVGAGTVSAPKGAAYTSADLAAKYSASMADTYVWAKALTGTVSIDGTLSTGSALTPSVSGGPDGVTYTYTWYEAADSTSAGTQVGTGGTYTLKDSDAGKYLYVTAADSADVYVGTISSARSRITAPLPGSVALSSPCGVGQAVAPVPSSTPSDATLAYTWYEADDTTSAGTQVGTDATYKPALADFGKYLYVVARDTSGAYTGTLTSARSMVVITGTFPSDAAASWTITPDGAITFAGTGTVSDQYSDTGDATNTPWYTYRKLITSAAFTGSVSYSCFDYWFAYCTSLASVSVPAGLGQTTTSMSSMFYSCNALKSLVLPAGFGQNTNTVSAIFYGCSSLTSLTLPTNFGQKATATNLAFIYCSSLTSLVLPAGFGQNAGDMSGTFFGCSALKSLTLPDGFAQNAGDVSGAFGNCSGLTSLTLSTGFGQNATDFSYMLSNCRSIASLDFSGASSLKATTMESMFAGCATPTQVKLGANWSFKGAGTTVLATLPDPSSPYSLWRAVGTGTTDMPKGAAYSSADLAEQYTGSLADTYVWAKALTGTVAVEGDAVPGSTLTAVPDGTPSDAVLSYTWYEAADATSTGTQVGTKKTYDVQASDVGKYLYAVATDSAGLYAGSISSAHTLVKALLAGTVTLSCAPMVDVAVTATLNTQQAGATASFDWYVVADATSDGTLVGGGSAYTPVAADYGKYLYAVASDSSETYVGTVRSAQPQVSAVLSVTVPTTMTLSLSSDGTLSGAGATITNNSAVAVHAASLKTTASAPFLLSSAASFDTASGCNVMRLALTPGSGTALDMAAYTAGAQPTAGQWNMAAKGGTIPLALAGKVKNVNEAVTGKDSLNALDISWSFAPGSL